MKSLYFVYHMPKTGGQTIRDHFDSHLVRGRDFLHLGRWDRDASRGIDDVAALDPERRAGLRAIGGHPLTREFAAFFPDRGIREVVFVREPAARFVSHYNFRCTMLRRDGRPLVSFEEFMAEFSPNVMTNFLVKALGIRPHRVQLSALLAELANMWMVGTTESMDVLAPALFAGMGIDPLVPVRSNETGDGIERHLTLTPELAEAIRTQAEEDVLLFDACRHLELRTMERLGILPPPVRRRPLGFVPT
jgi:hypothetical protein